MKLYYIINWKYRFGDNRDKYKKKQIRNVQKSSKRIQKINTVLKTDRQKYGTHSYLF